MKAISKVFAVILSVIGYNTSDATVISQDKLKTLQDYLERLPEIGRFKNIIEANSSAVVLIYSISDKAENDHYFYNIGIKPRTSEFDYKYGVISGVIISSDGVIVTPYDCVKHANRFVVSIDSEYRTDEIYGDISITKNDFEAKIIKALPELNLAFLQIIPDPAHMSRKFEYLDVANDSSITEGKVKHFLINGCTVYGKCKGEYFVTTRIPKVNKNMFKDYRLFCSRISSDMFKGSKRLVIFSPIYPDGVIPELHGGALITLDSTLLGLAVYQKDIDAPMSFAIPSSTIKQGMQLAVPWLIKFSEESDLGLKVEPLSNEQKKQFVKIIDSWPAILISEMSAASPKAIDGVKFGKIRDEAMKGNFGVSVKSVIQGSVADVAGIKQGDVILSVNGVCVTDQDCFYNLEAQSIGSQYVDVRIAPLSKKHKTDETFLYVPIYRNVDYTQKKSEKQTAPKDADATNSILSRLKNALQGIKIEKSQ